MLIKGDEDVLRLITYVFTKKAIIAQLEISMETLEILKTPAMKKLDRENRVDIVRCAISQGWQKK